MVESNPRAALLLDEIHAALLNRDYGLLPALTTALEAELDHPAQRPDLSGLQIIRSRADRNAATLTAIQRGIRSALRRLAEIRSASDSLVTYDRSGRKLEQGNTKGLAARF